MTDPKPKLVAVGSAQDAGAPRNPAKRRRWTDLGVGFWLLAVVLAIAVAIIATQARRMERLVGELEAAEAELEAANAEVSAYEGRFGEIRGGVEKLRTQLGELEALVEQPPAPER